MISEVKTDFLTLFNEEKDDDGDDDDAEKSKITDRSTYTCNIYMKQKMGIKENR